MGVIHFQIFNQLPFSLIRPYWADSVIDLSYPSVLFPSVCLFVCLRHWVQLYLGLSLALRSHDQFQASHWSSLPPYPPSPPMVILSASVKRFSVSRMQDFFPLTGLRNQFYLDFLDLSCVCLANKNICLKT